MSSMMPLATTIIVGSRLAFYVGHYPDVSITNEKRICSLTESH